MWSGIARFSVKNGSFGEKLEASMEVWVNGKKVGGHVSTNPTKLNRDVGGVGKPTIDDGTGKQVPLVGDDLYTGGVNWMRPVTDVSPYLVDGENTIVIKYNSALSNVQLDRGVAEVEHNANGWWGYDIDYLSFGPKQAKLVPFVELEYGGDTTAPTATIKQGDRFTVKAGESYEKISYRLHDTGKIDKVVLNGRVKDLTDNTWSDINVIVPGRFGPVNGENTLVVYDVAGNTSTYHFTLN